MATDISSVEPGERADALARAVIGAAIEVHRELGPGFLESLYEEALCVELSLRGIAFQWQLPVEAAYKGQSIGQARLDLLVDSLLIVELKSVEALAPIHTAQVLSYLKLTRKPLGLSINFNARILKDGVKRVALTR